MGLANLPEKNRTIHSAPTSLLSLPDETLEFIGFLLFESDNECCHCSEGHITTNFKSYIRVSKRIYRAALSVGWKAWELSSESYERLLQHKDHKAIVRCVRHLHVPFCDLRGPGLQRPGHPPNQYVEEEGNIFLAQQDQVDDSAQDETPAIEPQGEESDASKAEKQLETTVQYDKALSECISLFERLESLNITFCDWTMTAQQTLSVPTMLLHARIQPLLPATILACANHFKTITRLSFSGIRSQEDQAEMLQCIEGHTILQSRLKALSIIYRFDYLLFSIDLAHIEEAIDNTVDGKALWTAIGKLEKLESLTIAYMPQRDLDRDMLWKPEVFRPKLKRICLEEVNLSQGVVRSLLENRQGLKSLVAGTHLIDGIRELQATSEQPVTFPQLSALELSMNRGADVFEALAVFTHAPVTHLAITIADPRPFLEQYPEHKARQKTVEVLALHEIYSDDEDHRMNDAQKEEWVQKYQELGIKLAIQ